MRRKLSYSCSCGDKALTTLGQKCPSCGEARITAFAQSAVKLAPAKPVSPTITPIPYAPAISENGNKPDVDLKPAFKHVAADLADEEAALLDRLRQVREEKESLARMERERQLAEERNKQVIITVDRFEGGMVLLKSEYREDVLNIWQRIPGRAYRGYGENLVPVGEWHKWVADELRKLPKLEIVYAKGVEDAILHHLTAPTWLVELDNRNIKLTPGPRYNSWDVNRLPGIMWNGKIFTLPLSEAWRLYETLEKVEGVLYTDEAKEFTIKQVEARASLDAIGAATDWDYPVDFSDPNAHLRGFQRVGCAFVEATGGKALLAYQMGLGKTWMALAYSIKNNLRAVVICPASLKSNWAREVTRLSGKKPNVFMGANPTNHDIVQMLTSPSHISIINYDILARKTEYKDIKKDAEGYDHVAWVRRFLWVAKRTTFDAA